VAILSRLSSGPAAGGSGAGSVCGSSCCEHGSGAHRAAPGPALGMHLAMFSPRLPVHRPATSGTRRLYGPTKWRPYSQKVGVEVAAIHNASQGGMK
jgi:hypothetical protein